MPKAKSAILNDIVTYARKKTARAGARRTNRGVLVLFTGQELTQKSIAAECIANDLALDVYRIDLSAVVSKYIGETEKNLRRLFDAAEDEGAILFFDEADALFGKRSETNDSEDKQVRIAINHLLQMIKAYSGLVILSTKSKSPIIPPRWRCPLYVVHFPRKIKKPS